MFGVDSRALRICWTVFLVLLTILLIWRIRGTLLVFAGAIFFAYMLSPIVLLVERFLPRRRTLALALVYVLFVGALVAAGFQLIPAIFSQATSLVTRLPALLSGGTGRLASIPLPAWLDPLRAQILAVAGRVAGNLESSVMPFLQQAATHVLSGVGVLLPAILTPILAFFFLKDGGDMSRNLVETLESRRSRITLQAILNDVHTALKNYVRSLVILALISFAVWAIFLRVMGVEYELLLAGGAALLEFIPVIGAVVSLVGIVIVAAVTGSGGLIAIVIFWAVYRLFQDYILNPYLMKAGLEIHPLLVLFGVLAGDEVGGVAGMFFSVPVIAILKVVYENVRMSRARGTATLTPAPPVAS
jgi:predicted PurR-regulated permease PerM